MFIATGRPVDFIIKTDIKCVILSNETVVITRHRPYTVECKINLIVSEIRVKSMK